MYGIIVWLSAQANSALIVTDGGNNLAFGNCTVISTRPFSIGDLVFAAGMRHDQGEFFAGLSLIIPGFWPEVDQAIAAYRNSPSSPASKKADEMARRIASERTTLASNLTTAPSKCIEKYIISAKK